MTSAPHAVAVIHKPTNTTALKTIPTFSFFMGASFSKMLTRDSFLEQSWRFEAQPFIALSQRFLPNCLRKIFPSLLMAQENLTLHRGRKTIFPDLSIESEMARSIFR
jgi:hypothetical protein